MTTDILFACTKCDAQFAKWTGRCLECGSWGTVQEAQAHQQSHNSKPAPLTPPSAVVRFSELKSDAHGRFQTGIAELDRVLGGGAVAGALGLLGGEPGIGKSTLALMLAARASKALYCSAEESTHQVLQHAQRCGVVSSANLFFLNSSSVEEIIATIHAEKPTCAVVDSIQTIATTDATGEKGSVTQVRAATVKLLETAKQTGCAIFIVGHVTKDGAFAGPKTLEHLVDTVLYFEGDSMRDLRILRSVKNRFGATHEIGVFRMTDHGLEEVSDPSGILLGPESTTPGSILTCVLEGSRPLLVEIQALVNKTAFGYPERRASGFDVNRLKLLLAVLESHAGLKLGMYDVHVNIVGGIATREPAADLAVALAVASAYKQKTLPHTLAAFGEIDLAGNVRPVPQTKKRLDECSRLGIKRVIVADDKDTKSEGVVKVKNIGELIKQTS